MPDKNQNIERVAKLAAKTLHGDLTASILDPLRHADRPWSQLNEEEQREHCARVDEASKSLIREIVTLVATEGKTSVHAKIKKADNDGKTVKITLEVRPDDPNAAALIMHAGDGVNIVFGDTSAFQGGDAARPDKIGTLGVPDPDSEYTDADGHGVPDPAAKLGLIEPTDREIDKFGGWLELDSGEKVDLAHVVTVAAACHEGNREYCSTIGDDSQPVWGDADDWQIDSAIAGVLFHFNNTDADDAASHDNWMAQKDADGWTCGEEKDSEAKTHPCMVPFDDLPEEQKAKDRIFRETVWEVAAELGLFEIAAETELNDEVGPENSTEDGSGTTDESAEPVSEAAE